MTCKVERWPLPVAVEISVEIMLAAATPSGMAVKLRTFSSSRQ
ncbi:hypothetical protein [Paraburkholderia sp. Cpub6]|nr:hypothetical protein [Paraburkholderia sp. Cpub6]MBB5463835.1 hypothetical protein [Paraburkholderia sp. Cpub6]